MLNTFGSLVNFGGKHCPNQNLSCNLELSLASGCMEDDGGCGHDDDDDDDNNNDDDDDDDDDDNDNERGCVT